MTAMTIESSLSDSDYCDHATDALMNRGSLLRKWRALEAEDDAERAAQDTCKEGSSSSSDTLHYDSYLKQQAYYDDYKHVNYRFVDFGYVSGSTTTQQQQQQQQQQQAPENDKLDKALLPLMIEQDRAVGKGGFVWDAGVILAEHVIHEEAEWKRLRSANTATTNTTCNNKPIQMVELGAGTGITGLFVATAMQEDVHVALTDLPELMPLMTQNLRNNPHVQHNATAFPLAWGNHVTGQYDVILGADVVAGIYDPVKLANTMCDLCHKDTIVYLAVNRRLGAIIDTFETAMADLFDHLERRSPISRNKNPNVDILVATGKRSNQ